MTSSKVRGFTLLELMIVLLLVSILASVMVPIISVSSAQSDLLHQANRMRFEFQQLSSKSWIERMSFQVVSNNDGEWRVYRLLEDEWEKGEVLFVLDDGIYAESYSKELSAYSEKLTNARVAFFSSAEYTPVVITLKKDDYSLTIEGDGVNEFVIE